MKKSILFFVLLFTFAFVGFGCMAAESESTSEHSNQTSESELTSGQSSQTSESELTSEQSSQPSESESSGSSEPVESTPTDHTHVWGEVEYSWNGLECTAEVVCTHSDCQETLTETATAIYVKDTDATCYSNEMGHFEVTFENEVLGTCAMPENSAEQDDTMLAHTYSEITYVWEGDTCTASVYCEVDECPFELEETVTATLVTDTEGDCENNAIGHYEADFESELFETQATEANSVEIPDSIKHQVETAYDENRRQNVTACTACGEEFDVEDVFSTYTDGTKINDGANFFLSQAISMSEVKDKALRLEFKFAGETGKFEFTLVQYEPWAAITNVITIAKTASGIKATDSGNSSKVGRIVEAGGGWYAWEMNASEFPMEGGEQIDLVVPRNTVEGTVYVNWERFCVVEAYLLKDIPYMTGDAFERVDFQPISLSEIQDKAVHFEFKFGSETGSFGFSIMQSDPWKTVSSNGTVITKTASGVTASDGRIVELEDGWYAWEMNVSEFVGKSSDIQQIDFIYQRGNANSSRVVDGTLYIDWASLSIVDAYKSDVGTKLEKGAPGKQIYFKDNAQIAISDLLGKAIQVPFKLNGNVDGEQVRFSLHASAWNNMTGTVVISKSGDSVTSNIGIVVEGEDGWYNWQLCHALFMGDGSNKPNANNVSFIYTGAVTQPVTIDGLGVKVVDAYDKTADATQFVQGDALTNVVAKRAINKSDWNNTWSGFALYLEFKFENEADGELFRFAVAANSWANVTATVVISKSGDQVTANRGQVIALDDGWYAWTVSADDFEGDGAVNATDIAFVMAAGQPIAAEKVWILPYLKAV